MLLVIFIIVIASFYVQIKSLIHLVKRLRSNHEKPEQNRILTWLIIVFFFPLIGGILYLSSEKKVKNLEEAT